MITNKILSLSRNSKRLIVLAMDLVVVPFALWCSFSLRLGEFFVPQGRREDVIYLFFISAGLAIPIFVRMGLYRAIIRYIGFVAMWTIVKAVSLYTLVFGLFILLTAFQGVPRSVILINWLILVLLVGSTRAIARWWLRGSFRRASLASASRVAIYGAGNAGVQIAEALSSNPMFKPFAFIDDNHALQGRNIEGLRVYPFQRLAKLIESESVNQVIMAMPSVSRSRRSEIIALLEPYSVHVSTLPGLDDLATGRVKVDDIHEVGVDDLLGRDPVEPDLELLHANVKDKVVLVTGAGGSIGSELCRQILRIGPEKLVLFERSEHALYSIENELLQQVERQHTESSDDLIFPILASILNQERMESVCEAFGVHTIYHAAAYKHVPMVEKNPSEAVRNNVIGTYQSAMAAINTGVETFVLISTDKAVRPTSTMGATKRFAEMILQGLAVREGVKTRFTMVRFGNVLDSSGSVVPRFREQIQKGGPVTVTDSRIIRYFMTIPEAAQLVVQAGAMGKGGDVYVLDMGEPVKILDLARRMIHLSGFEVKDEANPEGDIEIVITGLRPGEKLYEELLIGENVLPTRHPLIRSANEDSLSLDELRGYIEQFAETVNTHDVERSRALLVESVRYFDPQCDVADLVRNKNTDNTSQATKNNVLRYPG